MYICQLLSFNLLHKKKQIVVLWLQWDFPAWELAVTIPIYSYFFIPHWRYSAHWVHVRSQSNHIKLIPTNVSLQFILSPQPTHMMSSLQWAISLSTQICLGCGRKCEFLGGTPCDVRRCKLYKDSTRCQDWTRIAGAVPTAPLCCLYYNGSIAL